MVDGWVDGWMDGRTDEGGIERADHDDVSGRPEIIYLLLMMVMMAIAARTTSFALGQEAEEAEDGLKIKFRHVFIYI